MTCPHCGKENGHEPGCVPDATDRKLAGGARERDSARLAFAERAVQLVASLANCQHERRKPVAGGAAWCIDCGAHFPKRGIVSVRHPSWVTMVRLVIDMGPELAGAPPEPARGDSERKKRH